MRPSEGETLRMKPQTAPVVVRTALKQGLAQLREAHVPSFTLAAELLLLHVLGRDRTWLYAHPEKEIATTHAEKYFELIARRAAGEPTQHLTGKQEFWGLEFEVTPDVLIPRPETEHVIEVALDRLALRELRASRLSGSAAKRPTPRRLRPNQFSRSESLRPSRGAASCAPARHAAKQRTAVRSSPITNHQSPVTAVRPHRQQSPIHRPSRIAHASARSSRPRTPLRPLRRRRRLRALL